MTKPKVKVSPVEEVRTLDNCLDNEFSYDIYDELTDKDGENFELFEPLEFFRVFYLSIEEIEQNKAKPLTVSKLLKDDLCLYGDRKLTDEQSYFFYEKIFDYYSDLRHDDMQIDICCREISKLQENLDVFAEDEEEMPLEKRKNKFQELLKHIETLPSYKEKIAYLIKEKTEYEQSGIKDWFASPNFGEKCQLEIDKLQKLMRLETPPKQATDGIKKHKDLTLDRAALAMNYLLTSAKANCHNTEKAKFISFLTGYSEKQVAQQLSKLHKKEDENYTAYEKDMKLINQYFTKLGLTEITNQIEKDLNI